MYSSGVKKGARTTSAVSCVITRAIVFLCDLITLSILISSIRSFTPKMQFIFWQIIFPIHVYSYLNILMLRHCNITFGSCNYCSLTGSRGTKLLFQIYLDSKYVSLNLHINILHKTSLLL